MEACFHQGRRQEYKVLSLSVTALYIGSEKKIKACLDSEPANQSQKMLYAITFFTRSPILQKPVYIYQMSFPLLRG